ncbi:MAG: hypothetical protein KJO02_00120 [Erythrobacter sp.]|nr:hypothetical protein [Erythrobacter sp.]
MSDDWTDSGLTTRSWFKPAVALWFAALLGGGLYLMPANVHAAIFRATGLGGPLVVSAIAATFGLVLGLVIAGRIVAATRPRAIAPGLEVHEGDDWAEEEVEEPRRRRVFSAREDIGEDGIGTSETIAEVEEQSVEEPDRAFEEILAEIPAAPEPEDEWDRVDAAPAEAWETQGPAENEPQHLVEEAEFEPVDDAEKHEAPAEGANTPTSLGDLSLAELEARLGAAIASHRRVVPAEPTEQAADEADEEAPYEDENESQLGQPAEDDPVIAFLRREATRAMPEKSNAPAEPAYDAQAALRHALDKLGKVGKPGD